MYRYINSTQATASLAKKLSAGWKQAYKKDVDNNRHHRRQLRSLSELEQELKDEFQQLLDEVVDPNIATTQVFHIGTLISPVSIGVYFKYKDGRKWYTFDWELADNTFRFSEYDSAGMKTDPRYREFEQILTDLTKNKKMKDIQEKYGEDILEADKAWGDAFFASNNSHSYKFFMENVVGSGLFIPKPRTGLYYKPLRVSKDPHTIICEECYYVNGGLTSKQVNKGYDTLIDYVAPTFTLLTERQVINLEK